MPRYANLGSSIGTAVNMRHSSRGVNPTNCSLLKKSGFAEPDSDRSYRNAFTVNETILAILPNAQELAEKESLRRHAAD